LIKPYTHSFVRFTFIWPVLSWLAINAYFVGFTLIKC
jgi:hypothetical protein